MARAFGSYPKCHRFESSRRYHRGASGAPEPYGPLVKWLRHRPFTAVTWVRIPYGSPTYGGLAQQVRAPASHAGGHWFESSSLHQKKNPETLVVSGFLVFRLLPFALHRAGNRNNAEGNQIQSKSCPGWLVHSNAPSGIFLGIFLTSHNQARQQQRHRAGRERCGYVTHELPPLFSVAALQRL